MLEPEQALKLLTLKVAKTHPQLMYTQAVQPATWNIGGQQIPGTANMNGIYSAGEVAEVLSNGDKVERGRIRNELQALLDTASETGNGAPVLAWAQQHLSPPVGGQNIFLGVVKASGNEDASDISRPMMVLDLNLMQGMCTGVVQDNARRQGF